MADKKKAETTETKTVAAKKVAELGNIEYSKDKQVTAILAMIPIVSIIMYFVEKESDFVKYTAAQYMILQAATIVGIVLWFIPCLGQIIWGLLALTNTVAFIYGLIMLLQEKRVDLPVLQDLAVQLMNSL